MVPKSDLEVFFVWSLVDKRFRDAYNLQYTNSDWKNIDWKKAVSSTKNSRTLLYKFCQEALKGREKIDHNVLPSIEAVVEKGDQNLKRLRKTLSTIKELWDGKVDYYVIKTRDDRPTGDADALFVNKEDYEHAIVIASKEGYDFVREEPFKGWIGIEGGVKVELHHDVSWFGMKALDRDFVSGEPREIRLMNFSFQTINEEAELALELAHWILDIQALGRVGFSDLVTIVEKESSWEEIVRQARKYGWEKQLTYHLSVLNGLCRYVYSYQLELPMRLLAVRLRPTFPFWVPIHVKIPFLTKKILRDNLGFTHRFNMLQLALRRYAWTKMWG